MSKFRDLLNEPLPSASTMYESDCIGKGCNEDGELDDNVNSVVDNDLVDSVPTPDPVDPEDNVEPLSPEGEQRVSDTISAVATPLLIKTELTESEYNEFVESVDLDVVVNEGFITEKTIVKFDKNAKKAQLFEVAVAACAREHKDPLYKKLETVYKLERVIKAKLRKKYYAEAQRKVKEYLKRAKASKSNIIKRIANKITSKAA